MTFFPEVCSIQLGGESHFSTAVRSLFMMAKRDPQRSEKQTAPSRPAARPPVSVDPPKRRPWLLAASAVGVLVWTLFLAWMAWQD
jgi:hypothetical protein